MHFRRRGNNVQLVRPVHDPVIGKKRSMPIGSLNIARPEISPAIREVCTTQEIGAIEGYIATARRAETLKREWAALTLPEQLDQAADWLEQAEAEAARPVFAEAQAAWQRLRRAAARNGLV